MMIEWEISPKTITFLLDSIEGTIGAIEDALITYPMSDDEKAEQTNDMEYYKAILGELQELYEENETDVDVETV